MTQRRKQRIRSPHPGVVILARPLPGGGVSYRARFTDPDIDRKEHITLDKVDLPSHEARRAWAITKSQTLAARRMEIAAGVPKRTRTELEGATKAFLASAAVRLRSRTAQTYEEGIRQFVVWAQRNGVSLVEELNRPKLFAFREHLLSMTRHEVLVGGKRGERTASAKRRRSVATTNRDIRSVKAMLNEWRRHGRLPHLDRDGIGDSLQLLRMSKPKPDYLTDKDCRLLLEKAIEHDEKMFVETREEKAGLRPKGTTPRYDPVAPFVAFVLLTGCRFTEAQTARWADVDLEAKGAGGRRVGEVHISADTSKTSTHRAVDLAVSPGLRRALLAMKQCAGDDEPYVFGGAEPYSREYLESARKRLIRIGAPAFTWQRLRRTAGTFLTNAPSIFGGGAIRLAAVQLGHSILIAEKHYWGVLRGISRNAFTLDAAMHVGDALREIEGAAPKRKESLAA